MARWTRGEIKTMLRLKENGVSNKEIAGVLGRSQGMVTSKLYYYESQKNKMKDEEIKSCPICGNTNTIGETLTFINNHSSKAYYCSTCLLEFNKKGILEPMLI